MPQFAKQTQVSVEKSQMEIRRILSKYGAGGFLLGEIEGFAMIGFSIANRQIKMTLRLPSPKEKRFVEDSRGYDRADHVARRHWEGACRQQWRALRLLILAKLEAIESGIKTVDEEFLPYIVVKGDTTVADLLVPRIEQMQKSGSLPQGFLMLEPPKEARIIDAN
jgi:hypothetical protein